MTSRAAPPRRPVAPVHTTRGHAPPVLHVGVALGIVDEVRHGLVQRPGHRVELPLPGSAPRCPSATTVARAASRLSAAAFAACWVARSLIWPWPSARFASPAVATAAPAEPPGGPCRSARPPCAADWSSSRGGRWCPRAAPVRRRAPFGSAAVAAGPARWRRPGRAAEAEPSRPARRPVRLLPGATGTFPLTSACNAACPGYVAGAFIAKPCAWSALTAGPYAAAASTFRHGQQPGGGLFHRRHVRCWVGVQALQRADNPAGGGGGGGGADTRGAAEGSRWWDDRGATRALTSPTPPQERAPWPSTTPFPAFVSLGRRYASSTCPALSATTPCALMIRPAAGRLKATQFGN